MESEFSDHSFGGAVAAAPMLKMKFRPKIRQRAAIRRLLSLATLVSLALSFVPISIPQPTESKDTSSPFPCQNRPCGCRSAEQCWKSCCCFSNQEKLAWAKSAGVKLPAYVARAAAREMQEKQLAKHERRVAHQPDCCGAKRHSNPEATECCEVAVVSQRSDAGNRKKASFTKSVQKKQATAESKLADMATNAKTVLGIFVQECRGLGHGVNWLPWAVVPQLPTLPGHEPPEKWHHPKSLDCRTTSAEPPEPPPRLLIEFPMQAA